ncbi:MAG: hypothetical protein A3J25_00910 [Pseudomonadales bacterium RIFCSPLOWO2_02_FULL_63_210]|nr:MAG: hypothetical protein A3J25_00910 [Pseudomonadales bacterium RIFCSPLOWO2_02_FULL_63_210]
MLSSPFERFFAVRLWRAGARWMLFLDLADRQQVRGVPLAPTQFAARQRSVEGGEQTLIK